VSARLRVGISEFRVARAPAVLIAYGLGSCLGVILDDRQRCLGGMAHTLLPTPRPGVKEVRLAKFVDAAIRLMADELVSQGATPGCLTARLVGGANMFEPLYAPAEDSVGARNVRAARATLEALEIPLLAEDIGGSHGRTVEFDLTSGQVLVRSVHGADTILPG
jgi:chemotaxis protein CheD